MKKTILILASVALLAGLTSCNSTNVKPSKLKGAEAVMATKGREIVDYQGAMFGNPIPEWVMYVSEGQYSRLPEVMPNLKGKKVFIASQRGDNLDFVKTWSESNGIKTKVAEIFESNIALAAETNLDGVQVKDKSTTTKSVKQLTEALTSVTYTGLEEQAHYWIQTEKKDDDGNVIESTYEYYLVYAMDEELFDKQLEQAMSSVENLNTESEALKEIVRAKMEEQILY